MADALVCLDAGVWIKFLVAEEPAELSEAATRLVRRTLTADHLVAPAFAWAEVGSVLRKKTRQRLLEPEEADLLWARFSVLPVQYANPPSLHNRAWEIAVHFDLPTLYDAAYLACTESALAPAGAAREFWTLDEGLLRSLGAERPSYVRQLEADRTG